ncbi:hypothetical protein DSUL_60044 [Desulfovibrionales bacterium]
MAIMNHEVHIHNDILGILDSFVKLNLDQTGVITGHPGPIEKS